MTSFNSLNAPFSMPASGFINPRKAAALDELNSFDYSFKQPDDPVATEETSIAEPTRETETKEAIPKKSTSKQKTQQSAVAHPQQIISPQAKASAHNWLAYAGIGSATAIAGGVGAGVYKTYHLPHSKIELKEGWAKNTKSPKEVKRNSAWLNSDTGNTIFSDLSSFESTPLKQIVFLEKKNLQNESGQKLKEIQLHKMTDDFKAYSYYEFYEGETKGIHRGQIIPSNITSNSSANKILILSSFNEANPYAFIGELDKASNDIKNKVKDTITAIKPAAGSKTNGEWRGELAGLWEKLTKENKTVNEIHAALVAKGYSIEKNFTYGKTLPIISTDAFKYNTWDDVAKAAVKNEKDWWKLVPKEGMGKFIGGGALAGLTVAGAGFGLWELAHKKQPSQPTLNRQG